MKRLRIAYALVTSVLVALAVLPAALIWFAALEALDTFLIWRKAARELIAAELRKAAR